MSSDAPAVEQYLAIDPAHDKVDRYSPGLIQEVWRDKYRHGDEKDPYTSMVRVVEGVYAKDNFDARPKEEALRAMHLGLWVPAGRIQAGAGTENIVTMLNCYVNRTIEDSMVGIAGALQDAMYTMQQGGGIGFRRGL